MENDISWVRAGVEVLCYDPGLLEEGSLSYIIPPCRTKIKRVATKSFSVEEISEPRFDLATQSNVIGRLAWNISRVRRCVPRDSEEAEKATRLWLARQAAVRRIKNAVRACREYSFQPTLKKQDELIAALLAIQPSDYSYWDKVRNI